MKILYGIQGTGHGHISRAREILPKLAEHGHIDALLSGYGCKLDLDGYITYRKRGLSFVYNNKGSIDLLETLKNIQPVRFLTDVKTLPLDQYDLIINDFEPVTAWAAKTAGIPCIGLSHQASFLSDKVPRPDYPSPISEQIIRQFAPSSRAYGFHFKRYDDFIEPPIIRSEVLQLNPEYRNHVTVYLPAYDYQTLREIFKPVKSVRWHIFSPYCEKKEINDHILIHPIDNEAFLKSIESCIGVITNAGFETCAEAMYLEKKIMTIPIGRQYEQQCNAAAMKQLGVTVLDRIDNYFMSKVLKWIEHGNFNSLTEIADLDKITSNLISQVRNQHQITYKYS